MNRLCTLFVATALTVAGAAAPRAQSYIFHADQDPASHQGRCQVYPGSGYRLSSLAVHGTLAAPRYTAVWAWRAGPEFVTFQGLDRSAYATYHLSRVVAGYRPELITTAGGLADTVYAGVYVRDNAAYRYEWEIDSNRLYEKDKEAMDAGMALRSLATFGPDHDPRFCAVWTTAAADAGYGIATGDTAATLQSRFDALTATGVRPGLLALSPGGRYAAVWRDDVLAAGWALRHDMDVNTIRSEVQTRLNQGLYPLSVAATGTGASARYAALFVGGEDLVARQWRTPTGPSVPGLDGFDTYMRTLMEQNQVRAGALAVARHGKLVYARGYTNAEPGYPVTQPTSLFRIGSVSKTITATAAHREIERGLGFGLSLQSHLTNELPVTQGALLDTRLNQVTLAHLLSHVAGYDLDLLHFDPTNHDRAIAAWWGTPLPISRDHIYLYMSYAQSLQHPPGQELHYSNYGYALIGSILEHRNPGLDYEAVVRRDLFTPLGLSRPQIIRPFRDQAWPGEVRYHPRIPGAGRSVCSATEPWVAGQYGGFNPVTGAPAGAWVMAAPDLAKYLSAFDVGTANPILSPSMTNVMWTLYDPQKSPNALRGWWQLHLRDQDGNDQLAVEHNGGLAGTNALIVRRADGLSFALVLNRDTRDGLYGGVQGAALNAIANQITAWPTQDLFPSMGIPSHTFPAPQISHTNVLTTANVGRTVVRISGTGLTWVDRVSIAGNVVQNQDDRTVGNGWLHVDSDGEVSFIPPQGMGLGAQALRVGGPYGWSNTIYLGLSQPAAPTLVGPTALAGTGRLDLFVAKGQDTTAQSALLLLLSGSNAPSVAPGVLTLGLGNGFSDFLIWPTAVTPSAATGAGLWFANQLPDLAGAAVWCQAVVVDFGAPSLLPLPTTNVVRVVCD